mgnify:CR=1 FL=1
MKKRVMIIWLVVLTVLAAMITYSCIRNNPKCRYYFEGKKYATTEKYCDRFYSYDGQYTNEALNNNKYFIRPWSLSESDYMKISPQSGEISKNIISKNIKLYSEYCYLEDLIGVYRNISSTRFPGKHLVTFFNLKQLNNGEEGKDLTGKYHMYGTEIDRIMEPTQQNIIHYEFDPSQKNMTFKTQYGCVEDSNYLSDIYFKFDKDFIDFPYDESKFKNVVNIEFTCERFDDNITITNIDNPNNIDITEEYLNNYKDLVKKHLAEYISVLNDIKEYFINKGMSYYKENVSIKNC